VSSSVCSARCRATRSDDLRPSRIAPSIACCRAHARIARTWSTGACIRTAACGALRIPSSGCTSRIRSVSTESPLNGSRLKRDSTLARWTSTSWSYASTRRVRIGDDCTFYAVGGFDKVDDELMAHTARPSTSKSVSMCGVSGVSLGLALACRCFQSLR